MKNLLNETFQADTFLLLGRRQLRTEDEVKTLKGKTAEEIKKVAPETYPLTYLDVSNMTVGKALKQGGAGYVVIEQKLVRALSASQVKGRRESMANLYPTLLAKHTDDAGNVEPFYVIDCKTAGSRIDLTPEDKIERIRTIAPAIYSALFADKSVADQLAQVDQIWQSISAVSK